MKSAIAGALIADALVLVVLLIGRALFLPASEAYRTGFVLIWLAIGAVVGVVVGTFRGAIRAQRRDIERARRGE